jgi:hypothetical protein
MAAAYRTGNIPHSGITTEYTVVLSLSIFLLSIDVYNALELLHYITHTCPYIVPTPMSFPELNYIDIDLENSIERQSICF